MNVGGILSGIRTKKGMSLKKLYHLSGVADSVIHRWETGETMPRIDVLQKVLNAMGYKLQIVKKEKKNDKIGRC
ncbi:helix-turn-helix domain-containing protein [Acetobacterium wieringae]|uniref:DNA-binding transcriptional repressor PuuR n=1 Tax=Acetobacterium wieringae TaxID=52694 RepID=A0A1F2PCZ7_9FIRM|nr:helix-turn-helix transcriptional regulator [Acetobacterium wieringae]OFV69279.1 DNA-binding transcriptional repressor PuuR [Acetobacterium wieringae]